ncbi:Erg28-like protein [Amniculicola lignicola CBS 123094]|uniref:Erg28-like protein n=1 Tax=Amniculicola lignicola CBS 123094 TaxID=1392246 RepID=A0A6A5WAT4_9PLEO|nr:Erg28-like protein [Amniculicola lignicola CBS 123094]
MESVLAILPQAKGFLPQWLFITSVLALGNTAQAYLTTSFTQRVYNTWNPKYPTSSTGKVSKVPSNSPATPLSSRTFGTWTFLQGVVRMYAAYNINDGRFYSLAMCVYAVAWMHFVSEWLVFRTAKWGEGLAGPVIVSTGSLIWMFLQWGSYVD